MKSDEDGSWPQHARDARNSRWARSRWPGYRRAPTLAFELPDGKSPPVVANGLVAYNSDASVAPGGEYRPVVQVTVRELTGGDLVWEESLFPRHDPDGFSRVIADDVLCVALDDLFTGFDVRTGEERWTSETGGFGLDGWGQACDSLTVAGRTLYISSGGMGLYALDVQSGADRWFRRPDRDAERSLVAGTLVADGTVVAACRDDGFLIALDAATGRHRWPAVTGPELEFPPCAAGDVVVAASGDRMYGIDLATGERRWRYRLGESIGGLACTDRSVAVTGGSAHLLSVDDGRPRWTSRLRGTLGPPTIAGDVVVVPAGNPPRVHGVGLDRGERLWTVGLGENPESEAVVAGRRLLITAGGAVKVFSFGDE
jgi:outer membrane protein assembly factor BamB